jgi:hypothetical protein
MLENRVSRKNVFVSRKIALAAVKTDNFSLVCQLLQNVKMAEH